MSITSPPAGPNPFVLFGNLDQLRDQMREWYAEWDAARRPLSAALLPLGEERIVSGGNTLDPSFIPCWVAAGDALRTAGLGDFPTEVFAHRQIPANLYPPLREMCQYAVWHLFTVATAAGNDELQLEIRRVRLSSLNYPASEWAEEFQGQMLDACAGLLREWERRNTLPFVDRLKAEAERLGLTWQQVQDAPPFGSTNGERRAFANWITSWHLGRALVGLEREEWGPQTTPPVTPDEPPGMIVTIGRPSNPSVDGPPPTPGELRQYLMPHQLDQIESVRRVGERLHGLLVVAVEGCPPPAGWRPEDDAHVRACLYALDVCRDLTRQVDGYSNQACQSLRIDTGSWICSRLPGVFFDSDPRFVFLQHASTLRGKIVDYTDWLTLAARARSILAAGQPLTDSAERQLSFAVTPAEPETAPTPPAAVASEATGEGGPPSESNNQKLTQDQTNALVANWFGQHKEDKPEQITRDRIVAEIGASAGAVSKSPMWIAFSAKKKAARTPAERLVPLTDAMHATVPSEAEMPHELAELIEAQKAEVAEEQRRHNRRHGPS